MAHLATVAATKVNGVAELHSQLAAREGAVDFSEPVAGEVHQCHQRRHAAPLHRMANPRLPAHHRGPSATAGSPTWSSCVNWSRMPTTRLPRSVPRGQAPTRSGSTARARPDGIVLPDRASLDVMVKRLHEYKRQLLKLLHIVTTYESASSPAKSTPESVTPRDRGFGAKAAPGYRHGQGDHLPHQPGVAVVNADPGSRAPVSSGSRPTTTSRSPRSSSLRPTCPSRSRSPARRRRARAT
jgi:starch phosphorylase